MRILNMIDLTQKKNKIGHQVRKIKCYKEFCTCHKLRHINVLRGAPEGNP